MKISKLCLGTAQLGMDYGINNVLGSPSLKNSKSIIDKAISAGINSFDTAPTYGKSEKILGICLEKRIKEDLALISKVPPMDWSKGNENVLAKVDATLDRSLSDLKAPSIHIYMFHRFVDMMEESKLLLKHLSQQKKKGKIKKIGVSIYSPDEAEASLNTDGIEAIQVPFNLIDKRLKKNGFLARAKAKGITIFSRSVFLQGLFFKTDIPAELSAFLLFKKKIRELCHTSGMTVAELALRYNLSIPEIDSVIIGLESMEQLNNNVQIFNKGPLDERTIGIIDQIGSAPVHIINPSMWKKQ